MKRRIIEIDKDKCNGCGICIEACHEGAIALVDGVATLTRDDYCDGLGDCLPTCPMQAISFVEREALAYDEVAVKANMQKQHTGCPGSAGQMIHPNPISSLHHLQTSSQLRQWPVQIKLVPTQAPYFHQASLLIAADCTAFAYGNIHAEFMRNRITLIGCPKLDEGDYSEKLAEIIKQNEIKSIHVLRMEVPCCGGITQAVMRALQQSGACIPWDVTTITRDGTVIKEA